MRRRDLLLGGLATGAAALVGSRAWGAGFGQAPAGAASLLLPEGRRAERCLELFLYGGLGPFESFYVVDAYGRPRDREFPNQQWWLFERDHERVFEQECGLSSAGDYLAPFGTDALGQTVQLGPMVRAFRDRPDLLARMRVVVTAHDLEPHEAAIPYALSGFRLGNSRLAGTGAHLQRYFQERDGARPTPHSYVFTPLTELSTDNIRAASAVGLHPGSARPLNLKIGPSNSFPEQLARGTVGDRRVAVDALRAHLQAQATLRYEGPVGETLRSRALADHAYALEALSSSEALAGVITPELFARRQGASCSADNLDLTGMSLEAAVALLTHPTDAARYALVVDGGLIPADGGGALDTHSLHLETHARNLGHSLRELAARINGPDEADPRKLNLDDTMIAITAEFGRTPFVQDGSFDGTNHHPYGYVQVVLGGPVESGVAGAIGPDGVATEHVTPSEFRAALLAGMGLWPFASESFAVGDVRQVGTEADGLRKVMSTVLGVRS